MLPTDTYSLAGRETISRWHAAPYLPPAEAAWEISAFCFDEEDRLMIVGGEGGGWALPGGPGADAESPDQALVRVVAEATAAVVERSVYVGAEEIQDGNRKRYVHRYWTRISGAVAAGEALDPESALMRVAPAAANCVWAALRTALAVNAKYRPLKEFYASLPTKRMAAGALFVNARDEILIVKPRYRPDWLIPGGITEAGESPRQGCARETLEEIGLDLAIGHALCVAYVPRDGPKAESLQWIFDGGTLTDAQIASITLQDTELAEYRFAPLEEALGLLNRSLGRRIAHAVSVRASGGDIYLE